MSNRPILIFVTAFCVSAAIQSCNMTDAVPEAFIAVKSDQSASVSNLQLPFDGVENGCLNVVHSVDVEWKYEPAPSAADGDWFKVTSVKTVSKTEFVIEYSAESMASCNSLERRTGVLSIVGPDSFAGKFINVRQGYDKIYENLFKDQPDGCKILGGRVTYTTPETDAFKDVCNTYISFNAWTESSAGDAPAAINVRIEGGAVFDDFGSAECRVAIGGSSQASPDNFHCLLSSNGGKVMNASTRFVFSADTPDGTIVKLANVRLYKVSEAERQDMSDDDEEWIDDDGENW